ncbi:MAG: reverse transcriptase/maturase family protein, partial [Clostridiales bacterium]|nr:reverse transcriptase/maturase family protein [Clostridiales bacterium]
MAAKLDRISELPAQSPQMASAPLHRLINIDLLGERHQELGGKKAAGVDHAAKAECGASLDENLNSLAERLKRKSYKPQPSLRACMPKADGKLRPPGMAAYEGKLAQFAPERVLEAVCEPKFRGRMFGFRPKLGCRGALKELSRLIEHGRANYIVDAGIKGFFNNMEHERILELMRFRISGPNILWLIKKAPAAGAVEGGKWRASEKGSEQGSLAPPIIANIYMRCALAQWFDIVFKKQSCRGECGLAACADDFAAAFQYKDDAERFLKAIADRFALFGLELEQTKTRLVEFGRFAEENLKRRRQGKPETFDFLGSAHCCSKSKNGKFRAERKTAR